MEFTAENLERAVSLFYRTEALQQAEAHQWLTEAQNSPQAWSFVWELLNPQRSSEVQFFAATTLHMKLMKYWNEVPQDHYELLKKHILEAIVKYAMGPKIVLNRLCIALSAYVIHTVPFHWPKAFEELVSSFQPQHLPNVEPERVIWILLEILTVIPEEFQSTALATSQKQRVRNVLQEVSKDILRVIEMCFMPIPNGGFDMSNLTTYLHAARCASAWIQLGGVNIEECSSVMNILIDLTCFVYWNRADPEGMSCEETELTEVTIEALTAIIQHPNTHKFKSYVAKYASCILEQFTKILDTERNSTDMNKDVVTNIYGLIVSVAESHTKIFIENMRSEDPEEQRLTNDLLTSILRCTDLPGTYPVDETSSTMTFGFWYSLQDDILSTSSEECAKYLLKVVPYYRDLVCILLRKSMFPSTDNSRSWSLDDREIFRCYRQDIADTFMYCYNVLSMEMLDIVYTKLTEALQKCSSGSVVNPSYWNEIETCLHAFSAVAESVEWENLYLPKLLSIIKNIPYAELHTKVLAAALETVGSYSEWITDHPDVLGNVIPFLISGIGNPDVSPSATMALKDVTHTCQKYLEPYAELIIVSCQAALQSGVLQLAECIRLKYCIGKVLSIMPVCKVMEYLNVILAPSFQEIQKLVSMEPNAAVTTNLITRLKMLSALISTLHNKNTPSAQQPVLVVVQNTMPLYRLIGEKYCNNLEVIDVLSSLFKHVLTTLMDDCKPLINDILQIVVSIYREVPQASVLVVAKTSVIMFGKDDDVADMNKQLIQEIVITTLKLCAEFSSNNQLSEKSDVLEGFFCMLAQIMKKVPQYIVSSGVDTTALFQCSILCLSLPEVQTLKPVVSFLVNYIFQSRETAQANVVQTYGESLVLRILLNLGGATPRASIDLMTDILLVLNKKYCDSLSRWLQTLLTQDGFPSHKVAPQQKDNFIKLVLREKANKRKLFEHVFEFASICRGIIRVENLP